MDQFIEELHELMKKHNVRLCAELSSGHFKFDKVSENKRRIIDVISMHVVFDRLNRLHSITK